jgi:hypothetical protein
VSGVGSGSCAVWVHSLTRVSTDTLHTTRVKFCACAAALAALLHPPIVPECRCSSWHIKPQSLNASARLRLLEQTAATQQGPKPPTAAPRPAYCPRAAALLIMPATSSRA